MDTPVIDPLPSPPVPTDSRETFAIKAGASVTAQALMVPQLNAAFAWQAGVQSATLGYQNAAAASASAAAGSATSASSSAVAATTNGAAQVALATTQANNAAASATSAQNYAAAAGAAAGMPALMGNAKKALVVKADETGVEWKPMGQVVGDILFAASPPAVNYLPANGSVYSQSSYVNLFSKLGTSVNIELTPLQLKTTPASAAFYGVAFGAGKFVAVSSSTTIRYSSDGINWTSVTLTTSQPNLISFAGGKFFAFTDGASLASSSPDGVTWTNFSMPNSSLNWSMVAFGNSTYVAVTRAAASLVATSTDGVAWTSRATVFTANSITFAFGMFIALTSSSAYYTSTDGMAWTARSLPLAPIGSQLANGILLLTVGSVSSVVMRSVDGVNWTIQTLLDCGAWYRISFVSGKFVIVDTNSPTAIVSPDGINWTRLGYSYVRSWVQIASGSNVTVAVNNGGDYLYNYCFSYDPTNQFATPAPNPPTGTKAYIKYQE